MFQTMRAWRVNGVKWWIEAGSTNRIYAPLFQSVEARRRKAKRERER